ncbi:hypothetical protein AWZ03_004226 [Drosophila navojoa]|uniref:Uncharacterized protein n=1 Tax=Drosophila navojoa TaxID=7232 RepID=A0A484BKU0_DRONA|nr:hypothetical protein AWZ03_004226 [Drosophila navojoa]
MLNSCRLFGILSPEPALFRHTFYLEHQALETTTIVEAILQLYVLNQGRILVTAGSNSACNTIALKICEHNENHKNRFHGIKGSACHVILSGDHKQLGPVVIDKSAAALGLRQSPTERLMLSKPYEVDAATMGNYDCTLQTRLRYNYRSHPKIMGLFNKLY